MRGTSGLSVSTVELVTNTQFDCSCYLHLSSATIIPNLLALLRLILARCTRVTLCRPLCQGRAFTMNNVGASLSPSSRAALQRQRPFGSIKRNRRAPRPACSSQECIPAPQQPSRRQALGTSLGAACLLILQPAHAGGLSRYLKRKGLDPVDSYIPPVLQARQQLQKAGEVMGEAASTQQLLHRHPGRSAVSLHHHDTCTLASNPA